MYKLRYSNYCDKRFLKYDEIKNAIENEIFNNPLEVGLHLSEKLRGYLLYKENLNNGKDAFRIVYTIKREEIIILSMNIERLKQFHSLDKRKFTITFKNSLSPYRKRKLWGEGEWINEADEFYFTYKKIKFKGLRNLSLGSWCAYCNLPKNHPWNFLGISEIPSHVHGGITFKEKRQIGFDCAHFGDLIPSLIKTKTDFLNNKKEINTLLLNIYKDINFLIDQCMILANEISGKNEVWICENINSKTIS